ncbi:MAG: hypothetical protein ONB48_02265 [candidate division KSB1 bacterium]|nr:hypothetical protein [candidate division KSB1 bacterium]MDZ7272499.1 hypothetical protein [candidate division KSB1 bacterium]MDZ7284477.1 hypothetical protein [candidate division KSB1 bacterium]MDZ7297127.1 hypothetical protein [candidate division KSB1 bacterium]MDZ7306575.1 hypothetical protein [candidate division KSB1 bacterium]
MMKRAPHCVVLLILLLAVLPEWLAAQSIYSRRGIGLIRYRDEAKALGMGGVSLAIADSVSIYLLNPATMASITTTHIQGGFLYDRTSFARQGSNSSFQDANVSSVSLLLSLKRGYTFAFGLQPYSRVEYAFRGKGATDSTQYEESLVGSGGLDNAYIALGATLGRFRLGVAGDFYFGLIERTWEVRHANSLYRSTKDAITIKLGGFGMHGGVQTQIGNWEAGAVFSLPVQLSTEISHYPQFDDDRLVLFSRTVELPAWFGAGVGYHPNPHWLLAAQWRRQQWGKVDPDKLLDAQGVNANHFGLGVEVMPSRDPLEGFFKRLQYRAGFTLSELPYREPAGANDLRKLSEWTVTGGVGLPFNRGFSRIDFAIEFGARGVEAGNLTREKIFRFSAAVSGSERWFQRRNRN